MASTRVAACEMDRPGRGEDARGEEHRIKKTHRAKSSRCASGSHGKLQRSESTFAVEHLQQALERIMEVIELREIA